MRNQTNNQNKRKFGTLYHFSMEERTGTVYLSSPKKTWSQKLIGTIGTAVTSGAFAFLLYSYAPIVRNDSPFIPLESKIEMVEERSASAQEEISSDPEGEAEFFISIPKINAYSKIVRDVDPTEESEYSEALLMGVAHSKGSSYPGEPGRSFLFAHSTNDIVNITQFNAVFYDLRKLSQGDKIEVRNSRGETLNYAVRERHVVEATDVSWLSQSDKNELVLQTCYPPGTTWKRLIVVADPMQSS